MKLNLTVIAIMLSILALAISVSQPIYSYLMALNTPQVSTMPSFDMPVSQYNGNVVMNYITASFFIMNNGSAPAHDVVVKILFEAPQKTEIYLEQTVPEIEQYYYSGYRTIYFPIGWRQLELAWGTYGTDWGTSRNYTITLWINCREVPSTQRFQFNMH